MSADRRLRWAPLIFAAACSLAWPRLRPLDPPAFLAPAPPTVAVAGKAGTDTTHDRLSALGQPLLLPNPVPSAHSVTLAELGDGRVAAAWFAGSREGAADVAILFSRFDGRQWEPPIRLQDRASLAAQEGRLIRKLGNPVLWQAPDGRLHLWFVSVSYGGWAGSALNHRESGDGGQTWSPPVRLVTSPFWNLSTLARAPAVALADGGIALPVYHEFFSKHPEWLRLDPAGQPVDKIRIPMARRSLQPAAAVLDGQRAVAVLRDAGDRHRVLLTRSTDGGSHWSPPEALDIPNPDAGIALLRLSDGRLLLAGNPQTSNRNRLALYVSRDEGASWSAPQAVIEGRDDEEYSYPALIQDRQGTIHLAYTWKRQAIRHERFSPAWLDGEHR